MQKDNFQAFVERAEGKMVAIASDETQDRHGDSLKIADWDLRNFKKNPVLQFAHDYSQPPVGVAKNIRREETRLVFEPVFHEFTELARNVGRMYAEGIMNAFSVGFIPHTEGEKTRLELLEISAVPVPANPSALILEKSISNNEAEKLGAILQIEPWLKKEVEETPAEIATVEEKIAIVEKAGKVLSSKNRTAIEAAIDALKQVLDADSPNDAPAEETPKAVEPVANVPAREIITNTNKGRSQPISLDRDMVEAIANNIGFIARKVKKL